MSADLAWTDRLALDVRFGYLGRAVVAPRQRHPQVVLNGPNTSVLRILRGELEKCSSFLFSVAFVSPRAIALIKQELVEFTGTGRIVTSDYLAFNSPAAFLELLNLKQLGIEVRLHRSAAFHPKGYIFEYPDTITAMIGSSNLTESALVSNHEWNLKVSAAHESDLAAQIHHLVDRELEDSVPLTQEWVDQYAATYVSPPTRGTSHSAGSDAWRAELGLGRIESLGLVSNPEPSDPAGSALPEVTAGGGETLEDAATRILGAIDPLHVRVQGVGDSRETVPVIVANRMQEDALIAIAQVRAAGERRAILISATGTGKTMLSALDVRAVNPRRLLFVVHREQILDRTIQEYRRVIDAPARDFGKLTGTSKQVNSRYLFATVQTLSQSDVLRQFEPDEFDYVIIDEAHRAGSGSHRRVIDHFRPRFMLGMTATPERTDSFNVFELFDYNVPYEIRLKHALEEDMLCPFHYYGVADVTFSDGRTTTDETDLRVLTSLDRIDHLVNALSVYGQAGVAPCGLIFCSRKDEARALSAELNKRALRGRTLRTLALTGEDPVPAREQAVDRLQRGELDYILTVDIFNEGVDIPLVNQVVMLRQTKSAIVFVQQLGRGLRKVDGKPYVVVIDFIGNYTNNYLIPVALFGDESLNRESLRQHLIAAEESGVLPGLASVRFDRISQERVLKSIVTTKLDSMQNLKKAIETLANRLGRVPALLDFLRFESVDPVVLATKKESYPALVQSVLKVPTGLDALESKALETLSHEVLTAKRAHEVVLLRLLLREGAVPPARILSAFSSAGLPAEQLHVASAIDTLTLDGFAEVDMKRYQFGLATYTNDGRVALRPEVRESYRDSRAFADAVDDIIRTGMKLVLERYREAPFTPGWQYSRKEAARILGWPRKWSPTIYGYRVSRDTRSCAIFVTLHKSDVVAASTAYADELIDPGTMCWYTRSRRTLASDEVRAIVDNEVDLYVFVKKDDAEGSDFYFLGRAMSHDPEQTTMPDGNGDQLDVVRMLLRFDKPIQSALYDYFHPSVTAQ